MIVGPTVPIRTPSVGETTASIDDRSVEAIEHLIRRVGPASLLGLPSLSLPCGLVDGLPVGLQVVGPALGEQAVLDVGHALELTQPVASSPTAYLRG